MTISHPHRILVVVMPGKLDEANAAIVEVFGSGENNANANTFSDKSPGFSPSGNPSASHRGACFVLTVSEWGIFQTEFDAIGGGVEYFEVGANGDGADVPGVIGKGVAAGHRLVRVPE